MGKGKAGLLTWILGILALCSVAFGGWGIYHWVQLRGKRGAYETCAAYTRTMLKSPASAKFPDHDDPAITYSGGGDAYTITAHVDAQNSFGAMIRSNFTCQAEKREGKWTATKVEFVK